MIDRFMTFESGAFNAHPQINQINHKRATLTRNSMTCLIVPSFGFAKPPNDRHNPLPDCSGERLPTKTPHRRMMPRKKARKGSRVDTMLGGV
jgi:hypothetical protein